MLLPFSYSVLFLPILFLASIAAISASNWYVLWLFLEINLLCFVPLVIADRSNQTTEAGIKYFLTQATGSVILLTAAISMSSKTSALPMLSSTLLLASLCLKLGMPPAHSWFPGVMAAVSWMNCLILSTWQKIVPLFVLTLLCNASMTPLIFTLAATAAMVGGIGGLNQTQLRPLLAYSSMGHMGWMLAVSPFSSNTLLIYFITYILISIPLMLPLHSASIVQKSISSNILSMPSSIALPTLTLLLSLGGLPPLLGFFPKWAVLQDLMDTDSYIIILPLILGSLINLFYYLSVVFSMTTTNLFQADRMEASSSTSLFVPFIFTLPTAPLCMLLAMYALTFFN